MNAAHILNHGPVPIHELLLIYNKINGNIDCEHSKIFVAIWQSNITEFNYKNVGFCLYACVLLVSFCQ